MSPENEEPQYSAEELEILKKEQEEAGREEMAGVLACDPVAQKCDLIIFQSTSRGSSLGKNHPPANEPRGRKPRTVILFEMNGKCATIPKGGDFSKGGPNGGWDDIATEVMGGIIPREKTLETFKERLLALPRMRAVTRRGEA